METTRQPSFEPRRPIKGMMGCDITVVAKVVGKNSNTHLGDAPTFYGNILFVLAALNDLCELLVGCRMVVYFQGDMHRSDAVVVYCDKLRVVLFKMFVVLIWEDYDAKLL